MYHNICAVVEVFIRSSDCRPQTYRSFLTSNPALMSKEIFYLFLVTAKPLSQGKTAKANKPQHFLTERKVAAKNRN